MGYYIEVPEPVDKARQLKQLHDAQVILEPKYVNEVPKGKVIVCVVENGPFDAVGVVYCQQELEEFSSPRDRRRKTWLLMDRAKVIKLCPQVEKRLEY